MALKARIIKVNLNVANLNEHHYQDYRLTLAQHPSETETRLMFRLAAYALFAQQEPEFTKGLCVDEEPDLWAHSPTGEITHWIDLGQPPEKRIRQAAGKAAQVTILGYHPAKFKQWLASLEPRTLEMKNVKIYFLEAPGPEEPGEMIEKNMELSCSLQEEQMLFSSGEKQLTLNLLEAASL